MRKETTQLLDLTISKLNDFTKTNTMDAFLYFKVKTLKGLLKYLGKNEQIKWEDEEFQKAELKDCESSIVKKCNEILADISKGAQHVRIK